MARNSGVDYKLQHNLLNSYYWHCYSTKIFIITFVSIDCNHNNILSDKITINYTWKPKNKENQYKFYNNGKYTLKNYHASKRNEKRNVQN